MPLIISAHGINIIQSMCFFRAIQMIYYGLLSHETYRVHATPTRLCVFVNIHCLALSVETIQGNVLPCGGEMSGVCQNAHSEMSIRGNVCSLCVTIVHPAYTVRRI